MKPLKLCIIDEMLEMDIVDRLFPFHPPIEHIAGSNPPIFEPVTHGTLCTSLLIGALQDVGAAEQVCITHYSISKKNERRSYSSFLNALDYCITNSIDIISISIGIQNRTNLGGLFERIANLKHALIIAANSNTFELTYPASLSSVLGVTRSLCKTGTAFVRCPYSPDGIDLIADLPHSKILQRLETTFKKKFDDSNSVLPPQIAAIIAAASIEHEVKPRKEFALDFLTGNNLYRDTDEYALPYPVFVDEDDKIPIILLPHESDDTLVDKAVGLQREFEKREYACSIISDVFEQNNFIAGHYCLNQSRPDDCARYYQNVVSDSLILLHCKKMFCNLHSIDLQMSDWQNREISDLCTEILVYFS